jgi:response regulator RpfG family c-di-GMP phosphodiesterase
MQLSKLRDKFDDETEKDFLKETFYDDAYIIRLTFLICAALYGSFSIVDKWQVPELASLFFAVRFYLVVPVLLITAFLTYSRKFASIHQITYLINFIVCGVGVVIMLVSVPENLTYYGGLFIVLYGGYSLIKLRYIYATVGGWAIFSFYILSIIFINGKIPFEMFYLIIVFIGANFLGMISSYHFECTNRSNFLQNRKVEDYNLNLQEQVKKQVKEITDSHIGTIYALARLVESRDIETGRHIERVGQYCRIIAENMPREAYNKEWTSGERFVEIIKVSSALHDIGKVGVPDNILNKTGKLTEAEFDIMKNHSVIGCQTLQTVLQQYPNNEFVKMGIEITRHHHEWFDGKGYPDGLVGKEIPLSARIVSVADAYDALVSKRSYKMAYSHRKAYDIIISESGGKFDPGIVDVFVNNEWIFESIAGKYHAEEGIA